MLISNAYAQTTAAAAGPLDGILQFLPIVLMFGVLYFLMIRPQQKKVKEHKALIDALTKGDEVMTQSGIAGRVTKIQDDFITVEIADKVEVKMQRSSVAYVLKGLLKNI